MKALSIQQPWAWAILYGGKRVENRKWPTRFRGRFAIHTGMQYDADHFEALRELLGTLDVPPIEALTLGSFIGLATLVDCVRDNNMAVCDDPWATGPWCFVLRDVEPLAAPIWGTGRLGFFDVPEDILNEIECNLADPDPEC